MLSKKNRLKAKNIKAIYEKGTKYRGEYGMLIVDSSRTLDSYEIAFVVSKKVGNAVERHRMTRLLREISRDTLEKQSPPFRFVYIAFKYCNSYKELEKEFKKQIEKAYSTTKKS